MKFNAIVYGVPYNILFNLLDKFCPIWRKLACQSSGVLHMTIIRNILQYLGSFIMANKDMFYFSYYLGNFLILVTNPRNKGS